MTEFIYNNVKHSNTNMLFFKALYIYSSDLHLNIKNDIFKKKHQLCKNKLKKCTKFQKKYYDKKYIFK